MAVRRAGPVWLGWLLVLGLFLVFLGERVLASVTLARAAATGVGALLVLGSGLWRWLSWRAAEPETRRVEGALALAYAGCAAALIVYALSTDAALGALGVSFADEQARARVRVPLEVLWLLVLALSLLPALAAQIALGRRLGASGADPGRVEEIRVLEGAAGGLLVALAGGGLLALGYVVSARDQTADLSYFKTATPGSATEAMLSASAEPIRALLFFPAVNPVKDEALGYLRALASATGRLAVEEHDRLEDPAVAQQYQVTEDGTIVFVRGDRNERLQLGADMAGARTQLRGLDRRVQSTLAPLVRQRRAVYLTTGHGELNDSTSPAGTARREPGGVSALQEMLGYLGYDPRDLGLVAGLGADVPADAAAVLVLGPRRPFLPEETASLERYLDRGGSVGLALDPEGDFHLGALEQKLGLRYVPERLADEEQHLRQRGDDSDRRLIITNQFSSHAAVTTLARAGLGTGVLLVGPGRLERVADAPATPIFVVRSLPSTFADLNGDYRFDAKQEKQGPFDLEGAVEMRAAQAAPEAGDTAAARADSAATPRPFRALVFASSSLFTDPVLVSIGPNSALVADGIRWLARDEGLTGETTSEEDQPIVHTRGQDVGLFYAAILGAPLLVLVGGLAGATRRRRGRGGTP